MPLKWARAVAKQLGLSVKKTKPHELKRALARRLGYVSWNSMPAAGQASVQARGADTGQVGNSKPLFMLKGTANAAAVKEPVFSQLQATNGGQDTKTESPLVSKDITNHAAVDKQASVEVQGTDGGQVKEPSPPLVSQITTNPAAVAMQVSVELQAPKSSQVDVPKSSLMLKDTTEPAPVNWAQPASTQLGMFISEKTELAALKEAIAHQLGYQSWAGIPPNAQAAIQARAKESPHGEFNPVRYADLQAPVKDRRAQLEAKGTPPPFPQRDYSANLENAALNSVLVADSPGTASKPTSDRPFEGPILQDGFIFGKGMNSVFSKPTGQNQIQGPRFRVVPTWMSLDKVQAASNTRSSEPLSSHQKAQDGKFTPDYTIKGRTSRPPPIFTAGGLDAEPLLFRRVEGTNQLPMPGLGPQELGHSWRTLPLSEEESAQSSPNEFDKPAEPAEYQSSIFDALFSGKKDSGPAPEPHEGEEDGSDPVPEHTPRRPWQTDSSIYARLFPEEAGAEAGGQPEPAPTEPYLEPLDPPEESLFVSLRNEIRNWIPEDSRSELTAPEPGQYGSHSTVVVISGASESLVDSDFYRIVPEGKYVEGWAGGLVKVVQARDPLTHAPLGQYFLMFHSRPSAVAYAEEVRRLHLLARSLHHAPPAGGGIGPSGPSPGPHGPRDRGPPRPQPPTLGEGERAAARSFTLYPAGGPAPRVSVRMWNTEMVGQIASKTDIADVVQALRPEAETPVKVLLTAATTRGGGSGETGLTPVELWTTLRDDGRERGTPWVLKSMAEGIMPVKTRSVPTGHNGKVLLRSEALSVPPFKVDGVEAEMIAEPGLAPSGGGSGSGEVEWNKDGGGRGQAGKGGDGGPGPNERFDRFILTFTQLSVARRFVRSWHKRAIWDAQLKRSVVIDAVALM